MLLAKLMTTITLLLLPGARQWWSTSILRLGDMRLSLPLSAPAVLAAPSRPPLRPLPTSAGLTTAWSGLVDFGEIKAGDWVLCEGTAAGSRPSASCSPRPSARGP